MDEITLKPIGVVHSPFKDPRGTPIQATSGQGVRGFAEVFGEYVEALEDLDGFSHVVLICYLHSKIWTSSTEPRCWTSSRTFRSSTRDRG